MEREDKKGGNVHFVLLLKPQHAPGIILHRTGRDILLCARHIPPLLLPPSFALGSRLDGDVGRAGAFETSAKTASTRRPSPSS
jgi:hypothetical protein